VKSESSLADAPRAAPSTPGLAALMGSSFANTQGKSALPGIQNHLFQKEHTPASNVGETPRLAQGLWGAPGEETPMEPTLPGGETPLLAASVGDATPRLSTLQAPTLGARPGDTPLTPGWLKGDETPCLNGGQVAGGDETPRVPAYPATAVPQCPPYGAVAAMKGAETPILGSGGATPLLAGVKLESGDATPLLNMKS